MRIAIGISTFTSLRGGGERVAANLAAAMRSRGHEVTLFALAIDGAITPKYPLATGIRLVTLEKWHSHTDVARLRQQLEEWGADVFLSMSSSFDHLFWATACLSTGIPFVYSEHSCPARVETMLWNRPGRLAVMSSADAIHLLLPSYAASVPELWRAKVRIIPNAAPEIAQLANVEFPGKKTLLYLGRLVAVKRPALLLLAFALLSDKHPDWRLEVWGDGPEAPRLQYLVHQQGLEDRVKLRGLCLEPTTAYAEAQLYCLPSRLEGFPMTVLEAMAAGLPVAGVADCEAMRGIVTHDVDGLLAPEATPQSLADTLNALMCDANIRQRLGEGARQTAARYAPEKIYDYWESMFAKIAGRRGATVMDGFATAPFSRRAELSYLARQEWLFRPEGMPMPGSTPWLWQRVRQGVPAALTAWAGHRRLVAVARGRGKG